MIFTGVGSRKTPLDIQELMVELSKNLTSRGWTLRSGGAVGADAAFEAGAVVGAKKEIYLPWSRFNSHPSRLCTPSEDAKEIAAAVHPRWKYLSNADRLLHARNVHQVLGADCNLPSNLLVCWTPGGRIEGGTATAIRVATLYEVPVFNLALNAEAVIDYIVHTR